MTKNATTAQAGALQNSLEHFRNALFIPVLGRALPDVYLTFSRNSNIIGGYFSPKKWYDEEGNEIDEIALNANILKQTNYVEIYTTLIHELAHLYQHHFGNPSRTGYHNTEYAGISRDLGIPCHAVDDPSKETGQNVVCSLQKDGPAERAILTLPESATIPFLAEPLNAEPPEEKGEGTPPPDQGPRAPAPEKRPPGYRAKYTCPACGANVWGRPGLRLSCLECDQALISSEEKKKEA